MKKLLIFFAGLSIVLWSCTERGNPIQKAQPDSLKSITSRLAVEGMSCTGCENTIASAVMQLGGVIQVKADYQKGDVVVTYDTTLVDLSSISQAIEDKGYSVKGSEQQAKL